MKLALNTDFAPVLSIGVKQTGALRRTDTAESNRNPPLVSIIPLGASWRESGGWSASAFTRRSSTAMKAEAPRASRQREKPKAWKVRPREISLGCGPGIRAVSRSSAASCDALPGTPHTFHHVIHQVSRSYLFFLMPPMQWFVSWRLPPLLVLGVVYFAGCIVDSYLTLCLIEQPMQYLSWYRGGWVSVGGVFRRAEFGKGEYNKALLRTAYIVVPKPIHPPKLLSESALK